MLIYSQGDDTLLNKTKELFNNIKPGQIYFVGGRPATGKSVLSLNLSNIINENILLINLELSKDCVKEKLNVINYNNDNVFIETKCIEENTLLETINKNLNENNTKTVIIDYIQLVKTNNDIKSLIMELKETAQELGIKIIIFSQLTREIEKRENKIPVINDIKNSELYDNISFLYNVNPIMPGNDKKYINLLNINNDTTIEYELNLTTKKLTEM